jgi:glycosyltransferase involved in cell wall biosynthesis
MPFPMISVITPSLNSGTYLEEAVTSVLAQQYSNFEHIVVDGGSTDATLDILSRYPHIKWLSEPDRGQSDAMNKGFERSSGDIIVYLNADDYFKPGAFETVVAEMSGTSRFVMGQLEVLRLDGQGFVNDPMTELKDMLRWWQPNAYCYNPAAYFYTREIQELVGEFNVEDHLTMDYEFLIKARQVTAFKKISTVLACFRLFPGTKTHENSADEEITFARFDRYLGLVDEREGEKIRKEKQAFFSRQTPAANA